MLNSENSQFEFLDALTIASLILQLRNQSKLFTLKDIHDDNAWAVQELSARLERQDKILNQILEVITRGQAENALDQSL